MARLIKIIDNELIEIADYRCPEIIFKGNVAPTLEDIKNEIDSIEDWCVFKETINPFQLYGELQRKDNIISELKNELYHIYNYAGLETKELADKINELEKGI